MDKMARRKQESSGLSNALSSLSVLAPLDQLLATVQVRWPFPEMGDLEYQDWKQILTPYPVGEIAAALNRLMTKPPEHDGEEYRGRPSLVDVTRTIAILRDEARVEERERERVEKDQAQERMAKRREEHPEEFFGWPDVLKAAQEAYAQRSIDRNGIALPVPGMADVSDERVSPVLANDIARDARVKFLEQQKKMLLAKNQEPAAESE